MASFSLQSEIEQLARASLRLRTFARVTHLPQLSPLLIHFHFLQLNGMIRNSLILATGFFWRKWHSILIVELVTPVPTASTENTIYHPVLLLPSNVTCKSKWHYHLLPIAFLMLARVTQPYTLYSSTFHVGGVTQPTIFISSCYRGWHPYNLTLRILIFTPTAGGWGRGGQRRRKKIIYNRVAKLPYWVVHYAQSRIFSSLIVKSAYFFVVSSISKSKQSSLIKCIAILLIFSMANCFNKILDGRANANSIRWATRKRRV